MYDSEEYFIKFFILYGFINIVFGTSFTIALYVVAVRKFCNHKIGYDQATRTSNFSLQQLYVLAVFFNLFALTADIYQMVISRSHLHVLELMLCVKILPHYIMVSSSYAIIELKFKSKNTTCSFYIKSFIMYFFLQYVMSAIVPALVLLWVYPFKVITIIACIFTSINSYMIVTSFEVSMKRFKRFTLCTMMIVWYVLVISLFIVFIFLYHLIFVSTSVASSWEYKLLPIVVPIIIAVCSKTCTLQLIPNVNQRPTELDLPIHLPPTSTTEQQERQTSPSTDQDEISITTLTTDVQLLTNEDESSV